MKYTIGIRLSEEDEIRGSDEVEHNIVEPEGGEGASHALGRKVVTNRTVSNNTKNEEENGTANPVAVVVGKTVG